MAGASTGPRTRTPALHPGHQVLCRSGLPRRPGTPQQPPPRPPGAGRDGGERRAWGALPWRPHTWALCPLRLWPPGQAWRQPAPLQTLRKGGENPVGLPQTLLLGLAASSQPPHTHTPLSVQGSRSPVDSDATWTLTVVMLSGPGKLSALSSQPQGSSRGVSVGKSRPP